MIIFAGTSALSMIRMPTLLLIAEQTLSTMPVSTMAVMPEKTLRITQMQMKSSWGYKCAPVVGLIRLGTIIQVLVSQCKVLLIYTRYNFHSIILKCRLDGGYDQGEEEVDDMEPSSSCSSPGKNPYGEDLPLELVDDSSEIDGEVGKRLNRMVPIPHVPRINGEIPSVDEATSDHQRLIDRLRLYDLVELKVQGDGNCQFRALSDQFYRSPEHHKFVRQQVINQLESHREIYEGYVPMAFSDYLEKLSQDGEWGDHLTLQAAADMYGVKIFVITSFKDTCYIEILPNAQKSNRVIFLSFWAEVHYNSIYPEGDLPTSETKKKKRWWRFRNNKHSRN